jgi:hypothetical protein
MFREYSPKDLRSHIRNCFLRIVSFVYISFILRNRLFNGQNKIINKINKIELCISCWVLYNLHAIGLVK